MRDKKATDAVILQVAPLTSVADYLVIGSAESDRQASAIAEHIDGILSRSGSKPLSVEGMRSSQWVLMDFGDVIVHIFRQDVRQHYALERLWSDAKRIPIPDESTTAQRTSTLRPVRRKRGSGKTKA